MAIAVTAARLGDHKKALTNLVLTIVGGLTFLGCQAYEWTELIHEGARLTGNPWGPPQFGQAFFLLTGFHGSHVLSGVIILIITAVRTAMRKTPPQGIEMAGLYWHFVDLVWVFIFTLFYLL
jgi:cytochrome c oxidase subunit 3